MSRIQRLGIGNGGVDCQISYMQGKKYPNASEIVKPVQGVSNRTLLKNPYNNLSVSVPQPGQRPLRITTDNRGNVFARSETMLVPGVTNDTLLKNPYNIKSVTASEKRTLTLQRIKDINSKSLPGFITENKGINEVMLQILTTIENKQVKLITIQLLKILITKNVPVNSAHTEQKFLQALNLLDTVLTVGRRIFKENTLSPTNIASGMRPSITTYTNDIIRLYNINPNVEPANIDAQIQTGLAELGLLSNALTRMFEYANAVEPSNTLSRDQINAAAYSGFGQQAGPQQGLQQAGPQAGPQAGLQLSLVDPSLLGGPPLGPPPKIYNPIVGSNTLGANINNFDEEVKLHAEYLNNLVSNISPDNTDLYKRRLERDVLEYEEYFNQIRMQQLRDPNLDIDDLKDIRDAFLEQIESDRYTELKQKLYELRDEGPPPLLYDPVDVEQNVPPPFVRPPPLNPGLGPQQAGPQQAGPQQAKKEQPRLLSDPKVLNTFVNSKAVKDFLEKAEYKAKYPLMGYIFLKLSVIERSLRIDKNKDISNELNEITDFVNGKEDEFNNEIDAYEKNHGNKFNTIIKALGEIRSFFFQKQKGFGRKSRKPQNNKVVFQVGKATQYRKY